MGAAFDPVIPAALSGWEGLLKAATVRLEPPSGDVGTGFVIADDLVVTCAHVVAEDEGSLPKRLRGRAVALGRDLALEPVGGSFVRDRDSGLDLVLLRIVDRFRTSSEPIAPVLTSDVVRIGDDLWTYGHPVGGFQSGQSATLRYEGTSLRSDRPGAPGLHRVAGRVGEGCSGSAVVNIRTGAVCGMLTTSDLNTSAHLVPVEEILARCPAGAARAALDGPWPRRLDRSQLEAGGWRRATPLLLEYLDGAVTAADGSHPYPVIEGKAPKTLSIVYVSRYVGEDASRSDESTEDPVPDRPDSDRIPASELFKLDQDVLLVGAPGAGKSSLLRHAVTELAGYWGPRKWHHLVPVRVDARDFVDKQPLAVLADVVDREVTPSSAEGWPAGWFDRPPVPAARWLVLVDGLDEVGSPEARKMVLRKITDLRAKETVGDNYRFVVTTRPLPASELPPRLPRFELLPLNPRELTEFAERWFTARELDDPKDAAAQFMERLEASGMTDPARTPLMASMLCQLFVTDQNRPLPRGRSAVYREFVDALYEGRWIRSGSPRPQLLEMTERYGDEGKAALNKLHKMLPGLIERLAYERHGGTQESVLELLTKWWTTSQGAMKGRRWRELSADALPELLRDSGLLLQRRDDFVFVHQTFAEFLTAERIAGDSRLSSTEFRRLFGRDPRWPAWVPVFARASDPAATSVARFLVDAWGHNEQRRNEQRGLQSALRRLAGREGGASFIATLVADGSQVDEDARATASTVLHGAAESGDQAAAVALTRMGDRRGADILFETSSRPGNASVDTRLNAARALADLNDPRGIRALRTMAADPADRGRIPAAEELVRRGHPYGTSVLRQIATDPGAEQRDWLEAARVMVGLQLPEGTQALVARMTDTSASSSARLAAAAELDVQHAEMIADTLADLVRDDLPPDDRTRAFTLLQTISYSTPRAAAVLAELAEDRWLPTELRITAARAIQDAERREQTMMAVAEDPETSATQKLRALQHVSTLDERHVRGILLPIVADDSVPLTDRRAAVDRLPPSPQPAREIQAALTAVLRHPALPHHTRLTLLRHVTNWWAPAQSGTRTEPQGASLWWCDTTSALILDTVRSDKQRRLLIDEMRRAGARASLTDLAASTALPGTLRLFAARLAMEISIDQGVPEDIRLGLVRDASLRAGHRLMALAEVAWDVTAVVVKNVGDFAEAVADVIGAAATWVSSALLKLPFAAVLAVLPFLVAIAANSFGTACVAPNPPEDWKLRVYAAVIVVVTATLYHGACEVCGTGRQGRRILGWGLFAGAAFGLMRLPEASALNDMGAYLVAVIPWDGARQI
ncbi:trypsin-like peptidase domain-containing protein [Streptomyces sp. NPDC006458]|uniref:trypsin-like peptidase domain-containing protein n=1 Tax=Streptomyces sp. NPDC006458 TaxID=3154302 RepID=UPI0033A32408